MLINGRVAIAATERGVEIVALGAEALNVARKVAKNRGVRVAVADARDLESASFALGAGA